MSKISNSGTIIKLNELADVVQIYLGSGAKKVSIPLISFIEFVIVPSG